jgi:hypothetical protein
MVSAHIPTLPTYSPRKANSSARMRHKNIKSPLSWHAPPSPATCGAQMQLTDKIAKPYTLTLPMLHIMENT